MALPTIPAMIELMEVIAADTEGIGNHGTRIGVILFALTTFEVKIKE